MTEHQKVNWLLKIRIPNFMIIYLKHNKERVSVYDLTKKDMNSKHDNIHQKHDKDRASRSELAAKDQNSQFYDFYQKPNKERASVHDLPEKDMDSKIDIYTKNLITTELSEMN